MLTAMCKLVSAASGSNYVSWKTMSEYTGFISEIILLRMKLLSDLPELDDLRLNRRFIGDIYYIDIYFQEIFII